MVRCIIYARVSTDEQASGEYSSIDSQIDICKHYIEIQKEKGWGFVQAYTDPGFSGKDLERPGIQNLIDDIKTNKVDVVIVYKIERLVRSIKDFYKLWDIFQVYNVTFVSATQQFDTSNALGKLMLNILLSFAQFERENTSEKTRDKMKQRARLGKWHGGWCPFGYDYDKATKKLSINRFEMPIVKRIYTMFLDGKKPSEIANIFNAKGARTKSRSIAIGNGETKTIKKVGGNRFNEDFVQKIIMNPLYKGYVHLGGEEFKGIHPSIVSPELWEKTNHLLKPSEPRKPRNINDNHVHILKGLLKCGQCDVALTPYPAGKKDKNGNPYLYYSCGKVVDDGKNSNCKVRALPAREFEKIINEFLEGLGQNKTLIESTTKKNSQYNKIRLKPLKLESELTEEKLVKTSAEINRLIKILKSQDMVSKDISEEYKRLIKEKIMLETQKDRVLLDIGRCKQDMLDAEMVAKTLVAFDKVIKSLTLEDQKELLQLLIRQITVWSFDPDKEKAPKEQGAFITKIRTKWFKIKLELYQFPEIETYYRSLSQKKASSDLKHNWLRK